MTWLRREKGEKGTSGGQSANGGENENLLIDDDEEELNGEVITEWKFGEG